MTSAHNVNDCQAYPHSLSPQLYLSAVLIHVCESVLNLIFVTFHLKLFPRFSTKYLHCNKGLYWGQNTPTQTSSNRSYSAYTPCYTGSRTCPKRTPSPGGWHFPLLRSVAIVTNPIGYRGVLAFFTPFTILIQDWWFCPHSSHHHWWMCMGVVYLICIK